MPNASKAEGLVICYMKWDVSLLFSLLTGPHKCYPLLMVLILFHMKAVNEAKLAFTSLARH